MERRDRHNRAMLGFLLFSILLHLLMLFTLQEQGLLTLRPEPERTYVEVRPPQLRELDLPETEPQKRQEPAKRLGPSDQVAKRETAPKGDAPEELAPKPAAKPAEPKPQQPQPPQQQVQKQPQPAKQPAEPKVTARPGEGVKQPPATRPGAESVPDIRHLTQLAPKTVARYESQDWRKKYRAEVEEGGAVWLDTEQDLLFSFFQRLKDNIYLVWQYPESARRHHIEGTCLLEMIINRDGSVRSVKVLETSGSKVLDDEAAEAVRKGAPYGKLPRVYEKDHIRILGNFQYALRTRIIY